jgi:hypothetical protein
VTAACLTLVLAGMGPDSRVLITKARKIAQKYMLTYGEPIPANQLVREIASVMQVSSCPYRHLLAQFARFVSPGPSVSLFLRRGLLTHGGGTEPCVGTEILALWKAAVGESEKEVQGDSLSLVVSGALLCACAARRGMRRI